MIFGGYFEYRFNNKNKEKQETLFLDSKFKISKLHNIYYY